MGPRVTLSDCLRILQRFLGLVIGAAIAGAAIAAFALALPQAKYEARFTVALAPYTSNAGTYSDLIEALANRTIPTTFAQVVMSPTVTDEAATAAQVKPNNTVHAVVLTDSNVIESTVTGTDRIAVRNYAGSLLDVSTRNFNSLYPLYTVTPLRTPATTTTVSRHLVAGLIFGAAAGAILAFLVALVIERARGEQANVEPASVWPHTRTEAS